VFNSVEFFGCAYPCRYSCSAGFAAFLQGLLLIRGVNHSRKPVEQFTQKLCELFGQDPQTAGPKITAAARSIAEALKSVPIDDPRAAPISRALGEVAGLDTDSEEELNEAIMGFALALKNLFQ
jgi:hypothetical protein